MGTAMIILVAIAIALFFVMIIYRKRKIEHTKEVMAMKEKYHKEMLETQVEIQKDTMQQIGREIHDNVGQKLTLAVLYAQHLNLKENNAPVSEKISGITGLINESLNDLRDLSQYLTQNAEGGTSLDVLLQKEVTKLNKAEACAVHFETTGKPIELSLKVNNMALRITQEFLHNSIKHSACKNIYLRILYDSNGVKLNFEDDGKGFAVDEINNHAGIGLNNIKKRAALIGAELSIKSDPLTGTKLDLFIPVQNII